MKTFQRFQTHDFALKSVQDNLQSWIDSLSADGELAPSYVQVTTSVGSDISVNHLLGRPFRFYQIVRKNAAVDVWDSPTINNDQSKKLLLRADAVATITLRIW